mgnify:CR=1 FL=1
MDENSIFRFSDADEMLDLDALQGEHEAIGDIRSGGEAEVVEVAVLPTSNMAAVHLGVQEGHRLVTSGPYAVVRHPIYLGLIDFLIGSALYFNDVALLTAAFLFVIWFAAQIRIEERFFAAHFGDEWLEYQARTPALFPRVLPRRPRS